MGELTKIILIGTIAGVFGTGIGGMIIAFLGRPRGNMLCFLLTFSSGIMIAVVFHDLIPEALALGNMSSTLLGIALGVGGLYLLNKYIPHAHLPQRRGVDQRHRSTVRLMRTGMLLGLGIAMHNFPEGLAIGAGYMASEELGFGLALALALHNIPEGMAMAAPLVAGGLGRYRVMFWTALAGLPMGIGALVGGLFGGLSASVLSVALGFAAGAMIFLVFHELIPEAQRLNNPRSSILGAIVGVLLGLFGLLVL